MPQKTQVYEVTAPDGKVLEVTGPAGASHEEVIRQAQALYKPEAQSELKTIKATQAAKFPESNPFQRDTRPMGWQLFDAIMGTDNPNVKTPGSEVMGAILPGGQWGGLRSALKSGPLVPSSVLPASRLPESLMLRAANNRGNATDVSLPGTTAPAAVINAVVRATRLPRAVVQEKLAGTISKLGPQTPPPGVRPSVIGPSVEHQMANPPEAARALAEKEAIKRVEKIIAPTGNRAKLSTIRIAPTVNEIGPEIAIGGRPALFNVFKRTEMEVNAAESAVPRSVQIPRQPIVDGFKTLKAEYEQRGLDQVASKIEKELERWENLPEAIPWEMFRDLKRGFFDANTGKSAPMRRAYGVLIEASNKYSGSPQLQKANKSYSVLRQALDNANIDIKTGRNIGTVGKSTAAARTPFPRQ